MIYFNFFILQKINETLISTGKRFWSLLIALSLGVIASTTANAEYVEFGKGKPGLPVGIFYDINPLETDQQEDRLFELALGVKLLHAGDQYRIYFEHGRELIITGEIFDSGVAKAGDIIEFEKQVTLASETEKAFIIIRVEVDDGDAKFSRVLSIPFESLPATSENSAQSFVEGDTEKDKESASSASAPTYKIQPIRRID